MAHKIRTTIQQIPAKPGQRLLVVSDIHGHLDRFIQLLRQMHYSGEDILIIVGDLIEKGPESLRVVQYVMELAERQPVYVSMGNVDLARLQKADDDSPAGAEAWAGFLRWAERVWGGSLFHEMLADMGIPAEQVTGEKAAEYLRRMKEQFHDELEFLWARPTILTAGRYLFVHGGVPTEDLEALADMEPEALLKNDDFLSQGYAFQDYVVVTGHWPTCLYRTDREDVSPVFETERQILCIDGGNGLKRSGQLNGLLIPDCQAQISGIRWTGYDGFPIIQAAEHQAGREAGVHIRYFDNAVELVEQRGDMALWKQVSSGKVFEGPVDWTYCDDAGKKHFSDYADTLLTVEPGDRLSVICGTGAGYYAKKEGRIGWYKGKALPMEEKLLLQPGAPALDERHYRRERELAVYDLLKRLEIRFERIDHREANTMEACRAVEEALAGAVICKNLFLCNQQRTKFYLLMMPGDKKFKTKELSKQIGSSRLSFAEAVHMQRYLQISPGSVSVMGLMNDTGFKVQLLMDRDILEGEYFGCHPCMNTSSIRLKMKELLEKFLPAVGHEPILVELTGE